MPTAVQMYGLAPATITFADQCKSYRHISPAYLPGTVGLKDVRTSDRQTLGIRSKTRVGITGGIVAGARREYETPCRNNRTTEEFKSPGSRKKVIRPDARGILLY